MKIIMPDGICLTVKEAVEYELAPDAYSFRSRKELTKDMLANLIDILVKKNILNHIDLNDIFQELDVKE